MVRDVWEKKRYHEDKNGELTEVWAYNTKKVSYIVSILYLLSNWGDVQHVTIKKELLELKDTIFQFEPTMHEKNGILNDLKNRCFGSVAFEIFPKHKNIVDEQDLFHVWIVSDKKEIPFKVDFVMSKFLFKKKIVQIGDVTYEFKVESFYNRTIKEKQFVYYVRNISGEELTWKQKQSFKDSIIGADKVAIEIIREFDDNTAHLIVVPSQTNIPFGLKPTRSSNF